MNRTDAKQFEAVLLRVYERHNRPGPSKGLIAEWFNDFEDWSLEQFEWALSQHRKTSQFFPQPSDLIKAVRIATGQPSAAEAWAIALNSLDESKTVVITAEILEALSAARPVLDMNTPTQAKQAFEATYNRLMMKTQGVKPKWEISIGHDPDQREDAIVEAFKGGLLSQSRVDLLLPNLNQEKAEVVGLLPGKVVAMPEDKTRRANIQRLREVIAKGQEKAKQKKQSADLQKLAKQAEFNDKRNQAILAIEDKSQASQ